MRSWKDGVGEGRLKEGSMRWYMGVTTIKKIVCFSTKLSYQKAFVEKFKSTFVANYTNCVSESLWYCSVIGLIFTTAILSQ